MVDISSDAGREIFIAQAMDEIRTSLGGHVLNVYGPAILLAAHALLRVLLAGPSYFEAPVAVEPAAASADHSDAPETV